MQTKRLEIDESQPLEPQLGEALAYLREGECVAVPTETVYGLAANALDATAVEKIFAAKERPAYDPLIVHLSHARELDRVAIIPEKQRELVDALAKAFWPGPLTLVLPKHERVPDVVTAGLPTVAVRVTAHPVMRALIRAAEMPLAAPSANRFGRISPTSAPAVVEELDGRIPLVIDGGACPEGLESTIIAIEPPQKTKPVLRVLRPGPVTREQLRDYGKVEIKPKRDGGEVVQAPGQLDSHYAPRKPLHFVEKCADFQPREGVRYGLLSYRGQAKDGFVDAHDWASVEVMSPGRGKPVEAATRLYFLMRRMDADEGIDEIVAEPLSRVGVGMAVNDRLKRASCGTREDS